MNGQYLHILLPKHARDGNAHIASERSVIRRRRREDYILAQMVSTRLANIASDIMSASWLADFINFTARTCCMAHQAR
jgi:hypothetical protein